jgi:hypothetical protein
MTCPDCFRGALHGGKPTGSVVRLHGIDTYVAEPANGAPLKGIVVIIPDAFGWEFVNIRLMADRCAQKRDYRVYAPEFMNGKNPCSKQFSINPSWPCISDIFGQATRHLCGCLILSMKAMEAKKTLWDYLAKPYGISAPR